MKSILYFQPCRFGVWRPLLSGLQRAASEGGFIVHTLHRPKKNESYDKILRIWNPSGCVVDCSAGDIPPPDEIFGNRAVMFLNRPPDSGRTRYPTFTHDSATVAKMAAKELLRNGFENYAYVPFNDKLMWSLVRGRVFSQEIMSAGKNQTTFNKGDLAAWLKSLRKPCGIFAANDAVAQKVVAIAQQNGLHVPGEIAVVGVDNDEIFCEGIVPGITSIETDLGSAGFELGKLLINEIKHPSDAPKTFYYRPERIVRRGSTRLFNIYESKVTEAVDFIRRHACTMKISIRDIMDIMKCSRCEATTRFRNATGRSILEEIHEVRFQRMCELLATTSMKISAVINFCGYSSETFPKRFFFRRTGMTMKQYRKENNRHVQRVHRHVNSGQKTPPSYFPNLEHRRDSPRRP